MPLQGEQIRSIKDLYLAAARRFHRAEGIVEAAPGLSINLRGLSRYLDSVVMKGDDPILVTSDFGAGAINTAFGAKVVADWNQKKANFFASIRKIDWGNQSGWRVFTADPGTLSTGVAENAALPDTVEPTLTEVSTAEKWVLTTYDISEFAKFRAGLTDGVGDIVRIARDYYSKAHIRGNNTNFHTQNGTLASNNFESVDRIIGNSIEVDNNSDSANAAYSANDNDIFGLDRDDVTTNDAQGSQATTDRVLTLGLVDTQMHNARNQKDETTQSFWMTDYDTFREWSALVRDFQQIPIEKAFRTGMSGLERAGGVEGAFELATYGGDPIIIDDQVVSDTSAISRIYYVDTENIAFKFAIPTLYMDTGGVSGNWLIHDNLKTLHAYITVGELWAPRFNTHAKIRDIIAS